MHKVISVTWGQQGAKDSAPQEFYSLIDAIAYAQQLNEQLDGSAMTAEIETTSGLRLAGDDLY